jgi:hypothetical protein
VRSRMVQDHEWDVQDIPARPDDDPPPRRRFGF